MVRQEWVIAVTPFLLARYKVKNDPAFLLLRTMTAFLIGPDKIAGGSFDSPIRQVENSEFDISIEFWRRGSPSTDDFARVHGRGAHGNRHFIERIGQVVRVADAPDGGVQKDHHISPG